MKHELSVRERGQVAPIVVIGIVVLFTFASAGANAIPMHRPSAAALRAGEQRTIIAQRRARILELTASGDHCTPAIAHELARSLVFDGRSARAYVDDYEARCGADLEMDRWRAAPLVAPKSPTYWMPYFSSL
jgi:hypothetical protein